MNAAVERRPMGLVVVLATVTMLFTAFTASYMVRRAAADWSPILMPHGVILSTVLLLAGSAALEVARRSEGRRQEVAVAAAAVLGTMFLMSQLAAWSSLRASGVFLATSPHASFFYVLTAVHGLHVVGGLSCLVRASFRPDFTGTCAVYWHLLAGIWVWVVLLLWVI